MDIDRALAYGALKDIEIEGAYSNIVLGNLQGKSDCKNISFVRELVYGTIKMKRLLDHYIDKLANRGISSLDTELLILVRMGLYQIIFMDSVPDHAAVSETVEIAKKSLRGKDGFVNGILRAYLRKKNAIEGSNKIRDKEERFSVAYSVDKDLVKLLTAEYGAEKTEEILRKSNESPQLFIYVNTLKTDKKTLANALIDKGIGIEDAPLDAMLIASGRGLLETNEFYRGAFFVQDISPALSIKALSPAMGERIADVASAPGGKSFASAIMMENSGEIVARDIYEKKLGRLSSEAKRLGIDIIKTELKDAKEEPGDDASSYDRVICDVPCTGTGVLRRKPEIKYKRASKELASISNVQKDILDSSSLLVRPGGMLMYSTCSILKGENSDVVDEFLSAHDDYAKCDERLMLPGDDGGDGFYYCIMKRDK